MATNGNNTTSDPFTLANWEIIHDDIVISGFSGRFPESSNAEEFSENLFNGVDMVNDDPRRWPSGFLGLPPRMGKLKDKDVEHFDYQFFGIHKKLAVHMDPQLRILLETTYEAIIDAGINPQDIRGTKTGVYVGVSTTDIEHNWCNRIDNSVGYQFIGTLRSMLPNRISYTFDFTGPSMAIDSACSSSLHAVAQAYHDIKTGRCDMAIACGANLIFSPFIAERMLKLGILAPGGVSRSFDANFEGYCRSEACVTLLLQKSTTANRIYAGILNAQVSNDGYKEEGITFPNSHTERKLMESTCGQIGLNPLDIAYVECHGPGTRLGDLKETEAIVDFMCRQRTTPLLIGSVKSNMGHAEPAAGVCSIAKVLLAMEKGKIPGNLHFQTPNPDISGLHNGQLKVVDTNTLWNGGIVSINSFGLGGANANVLLKSNTVKKLAQCPENLSRLIVLSGRTEEAVKEFLDYVDLHKDDEEYVGLINQIYEKNIPLHPFRGYSITDGEKKFTEIIKMDDEPRPIWFVYSGMGSQWPHMATDILKIDVCRRSLERCADILKPRGIDLMDILVNRDSSVFDQIIHSFVAISSIQIALTDLLTHLGIKPDGIIGQSMGELGAAYADGSLTLEQTLLGYFFRGKSVMETDLIHGLMAAVGLTWEQCIKRLPKGVYPVIFNAEDNTTISGPFEAVTEFLRQLNDEGISAKTIMAGGYAFHTEYIENTVPKLRKWLQEIIPQPKKRSAKWISSSVPEVNWHTNLAEMASAEYYVHNWMSPVLFHQAIKHIPKNAICIEISPHGLSNGLIRKILGTSVINLNLMQKYNENNVVFLMRSIGMLYTYGAQPKISKFYRPISYPVRRGTPMLNSKIGWDHTEHFPIPKFKLKSSADDMTIEVNLLDEKYSYLSGHKVFGQIYLPAAGYLTMIWEHFLQAKFGQTTKMPIIFENLHFHRATILLPNNLVKFQFKFLTNSLQFELCENDTLIVSGRILPGNMTGDRLAFEKFEANQCNNHKDETLKLCQKDIYSRLRIRGYDYEDDFVGIIESNEHFTKGSIEWKNNWASFLDSIMQLALVAQDTRDLYLPIKIDRIIIDPDRHMEMITSNIENHLICSRNEARNVIECGGVRIENVEFILSSKRLKDAPTLERYEFIPYEDNCDQKDHALELIVHVAVENCGGSLNIHILDVAINVCDNIGPEIEAIINAEPLTIASLNVITNPNDPIDHKYDIVAGYHCLFADEPSNHLDKLKKFISTNGFILLEENYQDWTQKSHQLEENLKDLNLIIVSISRSFDQIFILLREKINPINRDTKIIRITERDYNWLDELKTSMKCAQENQTIVYLISEGEKTIGGMGLFNCLKNEPNGKFVRLIMIEDTTINHFNLADRYFQDHFSKDLIVNILRNKEWGSLRHIRLDHQFDRDKIAVANSTLQIANPADLSTMNFIETSSDPTENYRVYYAGLNHTSDQIIGYEFSGKTANGKRIMGLTTSNTISTNCPIGSSNLIWSIPKTWSLKEAATIPLAYANAYFCLCIHRKLEKDQIVLVHDALTSHGVASVSVAIQQNLSIYANVENINQKNTLLERFPQLRTENISVVQSDSLSSFIQYTNIEFDLILNCGSSKNTFGHYNSIEFLEEYSLHLIHMLRNKSKHLNSIYRLISEGINTGSVCPLDLKVFDWSEIEEAVHCTNSTASVRKAVIQIRNENSKSIELPLALRRTYMHRNKSYIIVGGFGGFGLELCNWLVSRNARKLIVVSRHGVNTNYKTFAVRKLHKIGAKIMTVKHNVNNCKDAEQLLIDAARFGAVGGIFNLAAEIRDNLIENQNANDFQEACSPKGDITKNLDTLSRRMCPELDYFVCFSSVSCGRGSAGQTSYGWANSSMERICEQRHMAGYPAIAIQWGSIADTGIFYEQNKSNTKTFVGTKPQRIGSCLQTLDYFLTQKYYPVVSAYVLAEKQMLDEQSSISLVEAVAQILGIKNFKMISINLNLVELGVDSLMVTEIKHILERSYNLFLDPEDIRQLTFGKLKIMMNT